MTVKLLTEHHLEFLSLKWGFPVSSESTLVKMPYCWKSHVAAQISDQPVHLCRLICIFVACMYICSKNNLLTRQKFNKKKCWSSLISKTEDQIMLLCIPPPTPLEYFGCCFVHFTFNSFYIPVNSFSVMSGRVFCLFCLRFYFPAISPGHVERVSSSNHIAWMT